MEPLLSQNQIAEMCNTSAVYISKLKHNAAFNAYLDECIDEVWKDYGRRARKQMAMLADSGDYRAVEFLLKANGVNPTTKVEGSFSNDITINIV